MRKHHRFQQYKVRVYPRDPNRIDLAVDELGMVRGAHNTVAGFSGLGGKTDARFLRVGRLQFVFPTRRQRRRFMRMIRFRLHHVIVRRVV